MSKKSKINVECNKKDGMEVPSRHPTNNRASLSLLRSTRPCDV